MTPGPWNIFGPNVLDLYTIHTGPKPNGSNQICQVERLEDARLICAAHDLLDACIIAARLIGGDCVEYDQIATAIRKATEEKWQEI